MLKVGEWCENKSFKRQEKSIKVDFKYFLFRFEKYFWIQQSIWMKVKLDFVARWINLWLCFSQMTLGFTRSGRAAVSPALINHPLQTCGMIISCFNHSCRRANGLVGEERGVLQHCGGRRDRSCAGVAPGSGPGCRFHPLPSCCVTSSPDSGEMKTIHSFPLHIIDLTPLCPTEAQQLLAFPEVSEAAVWLHRGGGRGSWQVQHCWSWSMLK